ncbi:MarR family winged helix-turn-helix transcriptional regulator [Paracoccus sphaerophysae]|uniref:MarR family winged helix-turn-helix transcriptional regulator n=1 Tax=Paracoccus sphaerophysae TaxID=690417 RepID=UPI00235626D7|nr:MarR family transcriptional regulator [Paracoccus sphaerophysae]
MTDDPASADTARALAASLFAELIVGEQLANRLVTRSLPGGMQLSHFSVLNLLAHLNEERTPAQLAEAFHVGRSAMTNTLARLEWAGHVHVRPDWDDARRKWVAISPSGRAARDAALAAFLPRLADIVRDIGPSEVRRALPILRRLRERLEDET